MLRRHRRGHTAHDTQPAEERDQRDTHTGLCTSKDHSTVQGMLPAEAGDQGNTHTTGKTSDDASAGAQAQAAGDEVAGGASGDNGKKRVREAGDGQTGREYTTRSGTNDATAESVIQAPESSTPTATPAQATSKRHKTTASTLSVDTS